MFQITKQQVDERWDILPINLREILYSSEQGKIIWDIGKNNHFIDEKIGKIAGLVSYVIMGFIHPEDLSKEIKGTFNINLEIANTIYREIDKKIFAPIRSEIDKIYSPVGLFVEAPAKAETLTKESAPFIDIEKISLPKPESKKEDFIDLTTFERQKFGEEIKKSLGIEKELPIVPLPSEAVSGAAPLVDKSTEDKPVIIHKEIETKPTLGKQRSLGGLFGFLKSQKLGEVKIEEQKPVTAAVEMPIAEIKDEKLKIKNERIEIKEEPPKPPKVVHYSDLRTPVSKPTIDNLQPTTVKIPEVSMPPKPETKSKVFESEIEKAKKSGMILNGSEIPRPSAFVPRESAISEGEAELMIPIEIEEVPRQSFFSKILQFLTGLFVTKKKIIKEIPEKKENFISELAQEKKKEEISIPLPPTPEKEFQFPIEIKLPESPKEEPKLPRPSISELKTDTFKDKEIKPPEVHQILSRIEEEIKEKPRPIMPQPASLQPEKPKIQDEEVIDLRTFERIKK